MRITGGIARGQILKVPQNYDIRPTTDRVREAIFSMLLSWGNSDWTYGLDLFAGTGALGIEALSRDMEWVDFIEKEPRCCDIIKQNLAKVGFADKAHVYCRAVPKALEDLDKKYDLVLLDPPYADKSLEDIIDKIGNSDIIKHNSLVVVSSSSRVDLAENYGKLALIKSKRYGDTSISIYIREAK